MENRNNNYDLLINKLDQFTRKYYVNQIIRGVLWSVGIVVGLFVLAAVMEYMIFRNANPSTAVTPRKLIFWGFALTSLASLGWLVLKPMFHYFKLGKLIIHEQAAEIIGNHFDNVKDKLINVLQLKRQAVSFADATLINASINQKIETLQPVPFKKAIDLQRNRRYLRYALPPLLLLLFLFLCSPGMITGSALRLFNNGKEYEPDAPFAFVLDNPSPQAVQFSDYILDVRVEGDELPADAFIEVDNYTYKLTKVDDRHFQFTFNKIAKDTPFRFKGGGVESKSYLLDVLERPNIANFEVILDYPAYTGRADEAANNVGDLMVPAGTQIVWKFIANHTDQLDMTFSDGSKMSGNREGRELFTFRKQVRADGIYKLFLSNNQLKKADSMAYTLTVIPDLHPTITMESFKDSLDNKTMYFAGDATDDYGIRGINFVGVLERESKAAAPKIIPLGGTGKAATYSYSVALKDYDMKPGDKLTYYFEVWDNDGVNGSKSSRTQVMTYQMPSVDQLEKQEQANNNDIKNNMEKAMKDLAEMQREAKKLQEEVLQKKELDWQDKKKMEKLLEKQKEIEKTMKEAQEKFQENMQNQEQISPQEEQILQKQEMLEKMFQEVMSEEMKELMQKMEELLKEMDKNEVMEQMKEMNLDNKELEKDLDRMMEMFKQMEFEKEMQDAINKLDSLANKQEDLSEKAEQNKENSQELEKKQEELNKEFDKVQEKLDEAERKNEELESPNEMEDTDGEEKEIEKDMEQSKQDLNKQENQKASQKQKKAANNMRKMAQKLDQMMQGMKKEQQEEDMAAMRQLLENLVSMSFDQEKLMDKLEQTDITSPGYVKLVQEQYKLKDDFRIIEDSLHELSKRVHQIEKFITEKVTDVKKHLNESIEDLEERIKPQAATNQQYTMTYVNDLALMLSEAMEQMQQQMSMEMPGDQMCQKPGKGKSKGKDGKPNSKGKGPGEMQKGLNDQMKKMSEEMKSGKGGKMSKEFAQMAARQGALRKMLQDIQRQRQQEGKGMSKELQQVMDQMDKTETELVNKKLSGETLKRQEDILTRLLEHEKAEREREQDQKRESKTADNQDRKMPPSLEEYLRKRQAAVDMYKTVSPTLKPFYKNLVENYLNTLK